MIPRQASPRPGSGGAEWRESYPVVMTSFFGMAVAVLALFSFGLFIEPIQREFGWGRGTISSALIINSVISALLAPFAGRLIDRIGTRRVGIPGMVVYCAGLALLGAVGAERWQWWAVWFFIGLGYVLVQPTLWATAVSKRFDAQRGLALATTMCGSGVLLVFMPTVVGKLIADHGWRATYVALAGTSVAVMVPLMLLFFRDRAPPAGSDEAAIVGAADEPSSLKADLLSSRFIRLALGSFIVVLATVGLQIHFVPMVTQAGIPRANATAIAGLIGIGSIVGRLSCGFLMDRGRGQLIGACYFALPAFSSLFLIDFTGNPVIAGIVALVAGLTLGSEIDVVTFLTGRYFGMKHYATLVGTIISAIVLAGGLGPTIAGYVFDATGSYRLFVLAAIPMFLAGAALIASLGDYDRRRSAHI